MLKIYYGRESIDKEKFIYESMDPAENNIVLVPDQYTLEAEKQAFRITRATSLLNTEIMGMSRLGSRVISAQGGGNKTFIDKYGRHMLLSLIMSEIGDSLEVFRGVNKKNSFLELVNNFISELKQYNVTPDDLKMIGEGEEASKLLKSKISDLHKIYTKYEEAIDGKYTDTEDYIDLYINKISSCDFVKNSVVWIYGFDSFAPKSVSVVQELMENAKDVNLVMTSDDFCPDEALFTLPKIVMSRMEDAARERNVDFVREKISDRYKIKKNSSAIETLERELYAPVKNKSKDSSGLTICQAANPYNEAESAASFILHLIRDKGFRYRDIVLICNDQDTRGSIINRVFAEYGLSIFDDKKRAILHSPIAVYVVALVEAAVKGYRTPDIFKALKTGFSSLSDNEIEELENYTIKYKIKGTMWTRPFARGTFEYGEDGLKAINDIREKVVGSIKPLETGVKNSKTYGEFVEKLYDFLVDDVTLGNKINSLIKLQVEQEELELADETRQIWQLLMGILDQICELMGDAEFDGDQFINLFESGLSDLEVGVLPQTADSIMLGTMQRTRSSKVKAMLVLGANEGIMPSAAGKDGLFNLQELDQIESLGKEICKVDSVRVLEERLAIYRNLSKASDYLWISFCVSDTEGSSVKPSEIIGEIKRTFPDMDFVPDVVSGGLMEDTLGGRVNTLRHLSSAISLKKKGEEVPASWQAVMEWYEENDRESLNKILAGFNFDNLQEDLPEELAEKLFKKDIALDLSLSPSRLERFSRCPFSHFVSYGLRPEERRIFEPAAREIGDVFHQCLMKLSRELTETDGWDTITEEECRERVTEIVRMETANYREGVFHLSNEESYKASRIEETAFFVCWALIEQIRAGNIESSMFETYFGRGGRIKPIEIKVGENTIYIEGKIDRLDILPGDRVKIIDYKTGNDKFNLNEARKGYRLQLMTYLKAAKEEKRLPGAVFYFNISEPSIGLDTYDPAEAEKISEEIASKISKSFKLNGIMVEDDTVIKNIAGDFTGWSDIISVRRASDGSFAAGSSEVMISEEEFARLEKDVDEQLRSICERLVSGKIDITPKKSGDTSPCVYCEYKGICRFNTEFDGCNYEII